MKKKLYFKPTVETIEITETEDVLVAGSPIRIPTSDDDDDDDDNWTTG